MLPEKAGALLRQLGYTLATAESLTGGTVGARITSVPGASDYYLGGVIAYAAEIKASILHVPREVIDAHGVVSEQTATAMAEGVRNLFNADVGVATTGAAGPDPLEGHPAGTLCVSVADPFGTQTLTVRMEGPDRGERAERAAVIDWAADQAISLLVRRLEAPTDKSAG
ncbi:MAG TPA: nicotinamide-nucleotide amidohydrolase family protein [Streptosporangiaceae bacterium]|jgi:nicotinamide-nucleotide amidase|nr:nicotinamide-nucleotide amidohydrolase family protein [Streptosporangiaceae bacterium]